MRYVFIAVLMLVFSSAQQGFSQDTNRPKKSAKTDDTHDVVKNELFGEHFIRLQLKHKTYSADKKLYVGFYQDGWDETISIHETKSKKQIKRIVGHGDNVSQFKFSDNGKLLASFDKRKGWKLWDVSSGKLILELPSNLNRTKAKPKR